MKLFKVKKRFDPDTGDEIDPVLKPGKILICDYTGEEIDLDDCEYNPMYQFETRYNHDCEEVYYYDDEKKLFEETFQIDYHTLFSAPFVFKVTDDYGDNSLPLVQEWLRDVDKKGSVFYGCRTIEEAMRKARVRNVKRLLMEKKYTREELGLKESY